MRLRLVNRSCLQCLLLLFAGMARVASGGSLVITEVMAAPGVATDGFRGTEYWELTNFGSEDVRLDGYGFRDGDPSHALVKLSFVNLVLRAGESMIFFRIGASSPSISTFAQFRTWWGESKLPPNLQGRSWESPGLSGWDGDAIQLYNPSGELVDRVQFGRARLGRSFSYEPDSGVFGVLSVDGVDGAFRATLTADTGSPGTTTGRVPVHVLQQPVEQWVDAGSSVTLTAFTAGLPLPSIQWLFQGVPLPDGIGSSLTLVNVTPAQAGEYAVWLSNGFSEATSSVATLNVNTNPFAPIVLNGPADAVVFSGQTARFKVSVRALPAPAFQWSENGREIAGANDATLEVPNVSEALSGTRYTVRVSNERGSTNVSARLLISPRPDLRFTEIMAIPADENNNRHFDWFEVTNFGTNTVDLFGWRFSDEPALEGAFTITNHFELKPAESIVFAERLDASLFAAWWGAANLPETLQICPYSGIGLKSFGDTLYLWNPAADDPFDYVATSLWAGATGGVSFECEHNCVPDFGCEDEALRESVIGIRGAFRASAGTDVGSPGYTAEPPLRVLTTHAQDGELNVQCRVVPGRAYRLLRANGLSNATFLPLPSHVATNNVLVLVAPIDVTASAAFYRVQEVQ